MSEIRRSFTKMSNPCVLMPAVDMTPMSDPLELWSLPWHALQRSLAQGYCAEMSGAASFRRSLSDAQFKPAETGSWRVRARKAGPRG